MLVSIEDGFNIRYSAQMPELPEVESVIRGLQDELVGRSIVEVCCLWKPTLANTNALELAESMNGHKIQALSRRAKYILLHITHGALAIHLRMTGRLYISDPQTFHEADRWLRVYFTLDDGRQLRFSDLRKFGRIYWVRDLPSFLGHLGPEPLSGSFSPNYWQEELSRRNKSLKAVLLDQGIVAGLGNIYADESCFLAGLHPARRANEMTASESHRLHRSIRDILRYAIRYEGASFQWYRKPDGNSGNLQKHFYVFNREGEFCRSCVTQIEKIRLVGRGTHFCPHCQPV